MAHATRLPQLERINKPQRACYLHSNSCHHVCGVPKADIPSILATSGGVPRHYEEVELNENIKYNNNMPGLKFGFREVGLLALPANHVDTNGHGEVEYSGRENFQVVHYLSQLIYVPYSFLVESHQK